MLSTQPASPSLLARDPSFIAAILPIWRWYLRHVIPCEVSGLEKLRSGHYLLVANHNIGAAVEIMGLYVAWYDFFGLNKPAYAITHRFLFRIPGLRNYFARAGSVPATFADAERTLDSGGTLLVFPGGIHELCRPYSQRHQSDLGGRKGWARMAFKKDVPVVPVSIVGSHGLNIVFLRSRILAYALVTPRLLGLRWFPITLAQLIFAPGAWFALTAIGVSPWVAGAIAYLLFNISPLFPIIPRRVRIHIGDPIRLAEAIPSQLSEEERLESAYRLVTGKIQLGMNP